MCVHLFRFSTRANAFRYTSHSNAVTWTILIPDIVKDTVGLKFSQSVSSSKTFFFPFMLTWVQKKCSVLKPTRVVKISLKPRAKKSPGLLLKNHYPCRNSGKLSRGKLQCRCSTFHPSPSDTFNPREKLTIL
jgi:hypothetical protein